MFGVDRVCNHCKQPTLIYAWEHLELYDKAKDDLGRGLVVRDRTFFVPVVESPFLAPAPFLEAELEEEMDYSERAQQTQMALQLAAGLSNVSGPPGGTGSGSDTSPPGKAVPVAKPNAKPKAPPPKPGPAAPRATPPDIGLNSKGGAPPPAKPKGFTGVGTDTPTQPPARTLSWFNSSAEDRAGDRARAIWREATACKGSVKSRRLVVLERLNKVLEDRRAAEVAAAENLDEADGPPGGIVGPIQASFAAEAEATRDLLDTRVLESTTGWNDTTRVVFHEAGGDRLDVGLPTNELIAKVWGPKRCELKVSWAIPSNVGEPPSGFS
jgi:hypothetical protein